MSNIVSQTKSIGRRLAIALLSLAMLLQGQVVLAMACHSDQGTSIEITLAESSVHEHHHDDQAHTPGHVNAESPSGMHPEQQECSHCVSCGVMNYFTCAESRDHSARFKSPSPSVFAGALSPGIIPDGLLRPPR